MIRDEIFLGVQEIFRDIFDDDNLEIMNETNLPSRFLFWDEVNQRIELPLVVAESIANDVDAPVSLVEVLPTYERIETSLIWLNEYPK